MRNLLYIGICALAISCAPRVEDPTLLAQLGPEKLYLEDIKDRLPSAGSMEAADSAGYVDLLIMSWAKNVLLVQAAEFNLRAELQDFEDLGQVYVSLYLLPGLRMIVKGFLRYLSKLYGCK